MSPRSWWVNLCISSSVAIGIPCRAAETRLDVLLTTLREGDTLSREMAATKITALGTSHAPALAEALLAMEEREPQVRLERSFRLVAIPLVQAWRAAVKPGGGGEQAEPRRNALVERAKRVEGELRSLGPPVWPLFHRLRVCGSIPLAREATRFLQESARDLAPPSAEVFRRTRYFWAPVLLLSEEPEARARLTEHLQATLRDFLSPSSVIKERAEEEFCLLGDAALEFLKQVTIEDVEGLMAAELARLIECVSWRVWPELAARTGLSMEGWDRLDWREKAALVTLWKRVAGEDSMPVLRRIHMTASEAAVREVAKTALDELEGVAKPEALRVLIILARELRSRGEVDKALRYFWEVVERLPEDRLARYELAFTLHVAKQYAEAIEQFKKTVALAGDDDTLVYLAWYNMACACALSGRSQEAIQALLKSIENGYRDREHLEENDLDLESLRMLPEFQDVLKALEAAGKAP